MPEITQRQINEAKSKNNVVGISRVLDMAIERALRVAPFNLSVLVTGESGSGKNVIPYIIHSNSSRRHGAYFAVNCGAFPNDTIDSNLFGHVKGAFTDAVSDHKGYFETANGGTIFLDEVAEMPLGTQARLLRVLENGEFIKVGSSTVQKTDVRVVAATNKDLLQAVKEGKFRMDLYYRLSTVQINMPTLKERGGEDINILARFFARKFAEANRVSVKEFGTDALRLLAAYDWPGNVRQLKNVIEQTAVFANGNTVSAEMLKPFMPHTGGSLPMVPGGTGSEFDYTHDRQMIFNLLMQLGSDVSQLKQYINEHENAPVTTAPAQFTSSFIEIKREARHMQHNVDPYEEQGYEEVATQPHGGQRRHSYDEVVTEDAATVKTLDETERDTIAEALKRNRGKRKRTAEELNISERTLYRKIKQYNLEKQGT